MDHNPSRLASDLIARLRNRRAFCVLPTACCIVVVVVVVLTLLQLVGFEPILPPVESYFGGYLQTGGTQGHSYVAGGSGPVPLLGTTSNNCSDFELGSTDLGLLPSLPANRERHLAGARVLSPIVTDDHGSVWSVTATALLRTSPAALPDTLGAELWLTRQSKLEQTSPTLHIGLLENVVASADPADPSARPPTQPDWDASRLSLDAVLSREPFQAISRLAMEASSRSPIVIVRGSVEAAASYGATPVAPIPAPVSMMALISSTAADSNADAASALVCTDAIDFIAEENLVSRVRPSSSCVPSGGSIVPSTPNRAPTASAGQADVADPLWFRPIDLLVEPCVHVGTGPGSNAGLLQCDLTDTDVVIATNACPYPAVASNSQSPRRYSYTNVYVFGPRHNTLEIRHYQVIMTRPECRDRWQPVHFFQNTDAWHILASSNVPLFWPLPLAQIASIAMFNDTEMLTVSAPLITPVNTPVGYVLDNRVPPFEIYGVNVTSGVAWRLSDAVHNATGVFSNVLVDPGGSVWAAVVEQDRAAVPAKSNGSQPVAASYSYKIITLGSHTGVLGRVDTIDALRPRRPSMSTVHPTLQLAVSSSFVAYCEQLWPSFANMTRVKAVWAPPTASRPPITTGIGWSAFLFDDGSQVFQEGGDDDDQEVACVGDMVATQNSVFAVIANITWAAAKQVIIGGQDQPPGRQHDRAFESEFLTPNVVTGTSAGGDQAQPEGRASNASFTVHSRGLSGTLNLFQQVHVGLIGKRLFSGEQGVQTLHNTKFGVMQYPGSWVPDSSGVSESHGAGFGDVTLAGYDGAARAALGLVEQRGVVSQRQQAVASAGADLSSVVQTPWSNLSVSPSTEGRQCRTLQPDQLVTTYTFLTVGLVASMFFRLVAGWVWATLFTIEELPLPPKKDEWTEVVKRALSPAMMLKLFASRPKVGLCAFDSRECRRLNHHCQLRCCKVAFRAPGNTEPTRMQLADYNRHLEMLVLSNSLKQGGTLSASLPDNGDDTFMNAKTVLVTRAQFNGQAVTSNGTVVSVASRPFVRLRCRPQHTWAIDVSTGKVFEGISPAGCVFCCVDCRLALDPETLVQTRGPRTDASPWHLVTFFHFFVTIIIMAWTTVQTLDSIDTFSNQIADPRTFFYHYLVNAPADPAAACQSSLQAACFCDQGAGYAAQDPAELEINRWSNPWAAYASLGGSIGSQCGCSAADTACGLSCKFVLQSTGNCAAQAFAYLCTCGASQCNVTGVTVSAASESASEALKTGIRSCVAKYATYSQLCLVSTFIMVMAVALAMYCQMDLTPSRSKKDHAHNAGKQLQDTKGRVGGNTTEPGGLVALSSASTGQAASARGRMRVPFAELVDDRGWLLERASRPHFPANGPGVPELADRKDAEVAIGAHRGADKAADRGLAMPMVRPVSLLPPVPGGESEVKAGWEDADAFAGVHAEAREDKPRGKGKDKSRRCGELSKKDRGRRVPCRVSTTQDSLLSKQIGKPISLHGPTSPAGDALSEARKGIDRHFLLDLPQPSKQERDAMREQQRDGEAHLKELEDSRDVEPLVGIASVAELRDEYRGPGANHSLLEAGIGSRSRSAGSSVRASRTAKGFQSVVSGGRTTIINPVGDTQIMQSLESDDRGRCRCLLLALAFLFASSLLTGLAALLGDGYYVAGRTCTQLGSSADLPVPSTILPEHSALLRNLGACTLSQEWRDSDPEGTALRTVKVSFLANVVAALVLLLDPLALLLQLCCRTRNAWAAHPHRVAVRMLFSKPGGCWEGAGMVLAAPILVVGALANCCSKAKSVTLVPVARATHSPASVSLDSISEEQLETALASEAAAASTSDPAMSSYAQLTDGAPREDNDDATDVADPMDEPEVILMRSWDAVDTKGHASQFELATDDWAMTVVFCCSPQWECSACFLPVNKPRLCICGCCTLVCCFQPSRRSLGAMQPRAMARELATRIYKGKVK